MAGNTAVRAVGRFAASLTLAAAMVAVPTAQALGAVTCVDPSTTTQPSGDKVDPPVVLTPEANSGTRTVNFGSDRGQKAPLLHVKVDPGLPKDAEKSLRIDADQLLRTGDQNAETVDFPDLTFTTPQVSADRKRISFRVCLTPSKHLPAGKYTGAITLDGPTGVQSATMTITANAKDLPLFVVGSALTLVFAYLVLLYKAAADTRALNIDAANAGTADEKKAAARWGPPLVTNLIDVGFEFRSALTLGAAFGTLYALWATNPSWGDAGTVGSLIALIGVGLAAVGVRAIINPSTTPAQTR
jgi:hypothetical protein